MAKSLPKRLTRVFGLLLALLAGAASSVEAATVTWNANPESDIAKYIVSFTVGTPGVCVGSIPVGSATSVEGVALPMVPYTVAAFGVSLAPEA